MAEPAETTTWQWLIGGGLVILGGAIKWCWGALTSRLDRRGRELDEREHRLDAAEEARVKQLTERLTAVETSLTAMGEQLETHRLALHILVAKVARDDPKAFELQQVADILGKSFPIHLHVPEDMMGQLNEMDRGH